MYFKRVICIDNVINTNETIIKSVPTLKNSMYRHYYITQNKMDLFNEY